MNIDTHNKYFRDIDYNTDVAIQWESSHGIRNYKKNIISDNNKSNNLLSVFSNVIEKDNVVSSSNSLSNGDPLVGIGLLPLPKGVPNYMTADEQIYEARINLLISSCSHIKVAHDVLTASPG